jgi:HEAT repeat protein
VLLKLFTAPNPGPGGALGGRQRLEAQADDTVVLALGKTKDPRAAQVLLRLLDDDDVVAAAATAVGMLKISAARGKLHALLAHRNPEVRKRAKQALAKIDKAEGTR